MKFSATAIAIIAVSAVLTACGTSSNQSLPPLGPVTPITNTSQVTRPIDAYLPTVEQIKTLNHAAYLVTAHCIKGFGISENVVHDPSLAPPPSGALRTRLYGFFDPAIASTEGYDALVSPSALTPTRRSEVAEQVLTGKDKTGAVVTEYEGKSVPTGGCWKAGLDAIGGTFLFPGDVSAITGGGPQEPLNDPRIVDAIHKWSTCMKSHGFDYASPADAYTDPRWRADSMYAHGSIVHSPAEIATATADMACKQSTNYMGIAVAVETAYDKQYIAANAARLASFKRNLDRHLAVAEKIIATGGSA